MNVLRLLSCALAALALASCGQRDAASFALPTAATAARCSNPASGFAWTIRLDSGGRVDGWPARFEPRRIAWRDGSDGGDYDLDRVTGELTVIRASSTGGYVIFDQCRAAP